MHHTFTGSSRRPRQVNLSGRINDPFAAFSPGRQTPHASNPQLAVAIARQERLQRERDREKQSAARVVQRVWRGHLSRKSTYGTWRTEWDTAERNLTDAMEVNSGKAPAEGWALPSRRPAPYATADQCLSQLRLLVQFLSARKSDDVLRLVYFVDALERTFQSLPTIATEGEWTTLLKRLSRAILSVLSSASKSVVPLEAVEPLLQALVFFAGLIPKQMATLGNTYYHALALLTTTLSNLRLPDFDEDASRRGQGIDPAYIRKAVLALLRPITSETITAYEAFATSYLTTPNLEIYLGALDELASKINYRMLAVAVSACLPSNAKGVLDDAQSRAWLLSYLIFFQRYALGRQANHHAPELEFVKVVSDLLNSMATHLMQGLDADETSDLDEPRVTRPLPPFVKDQVMSLVNQSSVTGLLSRIRTSHIPQAGLTMTTSDSDASKEARVLATYALNLLRIFPRRGDDIRMWLYLGSAPSGNQASGLPAIKYFWQASRSSRVFEIISKDSTKVLPLLQLPEQAKEPVNLPQDQRDQEWTTILLFLELYTFVLKVTDDDEFFSGTSSFVSSEHTKTSWTRESALPLSDVKDMTVFLKNLAFTLYWNAVDLSEPALRPAAASLSSYFNSTTNASSEPLPSTKDLETKTQSNNLPGVTGIPLEYFKGLVTGLLRMLHERE